MQIGPKYLGNGSCQFTVWAPLIEECSLKLLSDPPKKIKLNKDHDGYFRQRVEDIYPGTRYLFELNGKEYPDPVSNYQPEGVHGPSEIIDHSLFSWKYDKHAFNEIRDEIIYEIHIGTFSPEGTFRSAAGKLKYLQDLGITAVEIMPVSQFPGNRNWGYDGVNPFAPQNSYGTPDDMKYFIDECHRHGISVILDVVYNHFGPEGNYLRNYGPYFTSHYRTPWGDAVNFDSHFSDDVRNYFFENALYWLYVFHIDGLRLDAIDHIYDMGAKHFLAELNEIIKQNSLNGNRKFIIAESDLNDPKIIRNINDLGYGFNAQWSDDFHHSIHSLITGEHNGYYMDYGKVSHLVTAYKESFVYSGKYSAFRKRRHGAGVSDTTTDKFVVCLQNHDQIGNRAFGKRLANLISYEALKLAAGALLLSPYIPLLFMGEEYGERNPFLYFISHQDPALIQAVRTGRKNEFSSFNWADEIPDPFSEETFENSKLNWSLIKEEQHKVLLNFYKDLIKCRKTLQVLKNVERDKIEADGDDESKLITLNMNHNSERLFCLFNFNEEAVTSLVDVPQGIYTKLIDSASEKWLGPGTSTPETLMDEKQNITIKGHSLSVYESGK